MIKAHSVVVGYVHEKTRIKVVSISPLYTGGAQSKKKLLFMCEDKTSFIFDFNALVPFEKPE